MAKVGWRVAESLSRGKLEALKTLGFKRGKCSIGKLKETRIITCLGVPVELEDTRNDNADLGPGIFVRVGQVHEQMVQEFEREFLESPVVAIKHNLQEGKLSGFRERVLSLAAQRHINKQVNQPLEPPRVQSILQEGKKKKKKTKKEKKI